MTAAVLLATATDLLRGLLFFGLGWALAFGIHSAVLFHRAGLARLQMGDAVPRLRPGMRDLTQGERDGLRLRQQRLEATSSEAWLSPTHKGYRRALCQYVARLADDRVPLSQIAEAMGVSKQRAHQQANAGRVVL